jgi:hypothetical protein
MNVNANHLPSYFLLLSAYIKKIRTMNLKILFTIPFSLFLAVSSHSQINSTESIQKSFHSISSHDLLKIAEELSSEKYKGRLSGSPEYMESAKWCAAQFDSWGLKPANNGSWYQIFDNAYSEVYSKGSVVLTNANSEKNELQFPDETMPGSNSASGTVSGEMVYVGFGITAPELGYDDYKNVDVKGKILIMETGIPYTKNDSVQASWTPYSYHRYKFKNAVEHGAAGLLYVGTIANPNTSFIEKFIYAHISEKVTEQLFTNAGKDYKEVKKQLAGFQTPSFELNSGQTANIWANTKHFPDGKSCNVVGLIEGSDPVLKNEVIIVGAHLDGQGYLGELFPGALDNASGVADAMGAAKALSQSEIKPKRSVLFILIGGEECGLYGSKFYADNPIFPVDKTVFMINLDMVGNGTGFFVSSGKSYPEIYNHFETANTNYLHRTMKASEWRKSYGRPRSDAANFENAGIKTLSLWTRDSVYPVYYHHPKDKIDVLTPEIMEDAAKLLYLGVLGVANDDGI